MLASRRPGPSPQEAHEWRAVASLVIIIALIIIIIVAIGIRALIAVDCHSIVTRRYRKREQR